MNRKKLNMDNVFAKKRQRNNQLFNDHRKNVMPQIETLKSQRTQSHSPLVQGDLSARLGQARSLTKTGLDRSYQILDTVMSHSEQLKQEDVVQKYIEIEQVCQAKIAQYLQFQQMLDALESDLHARIDQIISDIAGVDEGESREFTKVNDTVPVADRHPKAPITKADKVNGSDDAKTFEKGLAAKAAGMGVSPNVIAKAMKK